MDVPDIGFEALPFTMIVRRNEEQVFNTLKCYVVHVYIADIAAPVRIGLKINAPLAVSGCHAIFDVNVLYARGHLAANHNTVKPFKPAVPDNDIFRSGADLTAFVVAPRLY